MPHALLLNLRDTQRLAGGSERHVFRIEGRTDVVVKVMRSKYLRSLRMADDRTLLGWLKVRRAYALFRREQKALGDVMLRAAIREEMPPVMGFRGYILTEKGLGQIVEMIADENGGVAPSLHDQLQGDSVTEAQIGALNSFVAQLYDWHVVAHDLSPKNIVWNGPQARYVLVDGFGDRALLPLKSWNRRLNNRRLDRAFKEMGEKSGLTWMREKRAFARD
ncbi:YrbL family protein [Roseivivax sp.]